jgi:hypothetical protein
MGLRSLLIRPSVLHHSRWPAPWQWLVVLLVAATIWCFVDVRRRGEVHPGAPLWHKTDLTVYTEAGAAFFDGRPPYKVCNPRGWTYVYPPLFAILLAPLHVLSMPNQATVWFFICLAICWGAYREAARIVALICNPGDDPIAVRPTCFPWLGWVAAATVTLPALNCLQRGQVTVVIVFLMLLGLRLILMGSGSTAFLGGIVLALSISIKVIPILPVAFLVFLQLVGFVRALRKHQPTAARHGWQLAGSTLGVAFGLALFLFLLPAALIGWKANLGHLDTWSHLVLSSAGDSFATPGFEKDTHSVRNQCLGNALYRLGNFAAYMCEAGPEDPLVDPDRPPLRMMDARSADVSLIAVRSTLLLTLLIVGLQLGCDRNIVLSQATGFGLACAAMLVASPVARSHYFVMWAPAALFVPLWLNCQGRIRAAVMMGTVPLVLIVLQYVLLPYVGRVGLLGLGATAWLMAAMVLTVRTLQSTQSANFLRDGSVVGWTKAA